MILFIFFIYLLEIGDPSKIFCISEAYGTDCKKHVGASGKI